MTRRAGASGDLFGEDAAAPPAPPGSTPPASAHPEAAADVPLAERLRPRRVADILGQDHLLAPEAPLGRMLAGRRLASLILWGPPGTGKTSLARLVAAETGHAVEALSAVMAGLPDLRRVIESARLRRQSGRGTVLFLDEIHRWSRTQQDALLPHMESGAVVLIGATTENPSFALAPALLSRAQVLPLKPLDAAALQSLLARAEAALGHALPLTGAARQTLLAMAEGDGRALIGLAEALADLDPSVQIDASALPTLVTRRAAPYDRAGDGHHGLLSAFHKSLRGSDPDAALYYAARMITAGEPPETLLRRLTCCAAEDVGLADPQALVQALAAWQAFERLGWPEGRLPFAQAVVYVAAAPKSNAAHAAFEAALALARQTASLPPPAHLLNAPTDLMRAMGRGAGYVYDHDAPGAVSRQSFLPASLAGTEAAHLYSPSDRGHERRIADRLDAIARVRASGDAPARSTGQDRD